MRDLQGERKDSGQIKRLSLIRVPIRMTGESAFAEDLLYMIVCLCVSRPSREAADLPR